MTAQAVGALMVPKGSKYNTIKAFVSAAKANPGKLTVAGVGSTGAANFGALAEILGIKTAYVPVSGGVGKMMPMLQGKHVDAGMTASSHAVKHRATVDTIVVAGPERVGALPSIPNEPRWNYMTTWGVMAPPVVFDHSVGTPGWLPHRIPIVSEVVSPGCLAKSRVVSPG